MPEYTWPLSNTTTPDEMNTSFGPRLNNGRWDMHDGIDLPAAIGTPVHAVREGKVHRSGPGGTDGFSSRHVILKVDDPSDGTLYILYLHLDSVAEGIADKCVDQGDVLGTVGDDDATYPHLHLEFRKGTLCQIDSVHPLRYLPYADTENFEFSSLPVGLIRRDGLMTARLLFEADSKLEGDLLLIEVDLKRGATLLETRVVDFDDKRTINEGNSDKLMFKNNIAVEGYQRSNMVGDRRTKLKYGVLVRRIPERCDRLIARVIDIGGNTVESGNKAVLAHSATEVLVDFEDEPMPPSGWNILTRGAGAAVEFGASAGRPCSRGTQGMLCTVASDAGTQRAAIEFELPDGRFEWIAEGWFNPEELDLAAGEFINLLHFSSGSNLSVAAGVQRIEDSLRARIVAKQPAGTFKEAVGDAQIATGVWRQWKLNLRRIGTRETTAILRLSDRGKFKSQARLNWNSTAFPPLAFRVGIGLASAGATATILTDDVRLSESPFS